MRFTIAIPLFALSLYTASAQTVSYSYDAAGNRVKREIILNRQNAPGQRSAITNSLTETLAMKTLRIYPNPTHGRLKVEVIGYETEDDCELVVVNTAGQLVVRTKVTSAYTDLNLSKQSNGMYLLRINLNGEQSTWKIIKK